MKVTKIISFFAVMFFASSCFAVQNNGNIPKIQPFGAMSKRPTQSKNTLSKEQIRATLERNIVKSGKRTSLTIPLQDFNQKLAKAGILSFNFVENPKNTLYIFTDGKCPLSAKAYMQIKQQKTLFEAHKVNVKWLPIVKDGDPQYYQKSTHLFIDDINYQDSTPNEIRELIQFNTEIFATSFKAIGTPLVFWHTRDGGYDFVLGYVKPAQVNTFLASVEKSNTVLDYLYSMTVQSKQ